MPSPEPARKHLLTVRPQRDFTHLRPHLARAMLTKGQILQEFDAPMQSAYFLEGGIASLLSRDAQDRCLEVAMVGRLGLIGIPIVLGNIASPHRCIVQVPGEARRIKADDLREAMARSTALQRILLSYVQAVLAQISQLVVCNARHSLESRLARRILMTHEQVEGKELPLTHGLLSSLLDVRRAGVTEAMQRLEEAGIIEQSRRGIVMVLDRAGLEQISCECYRIISAEYRSPTCSG